MIDVHLTLLICTSSDAYLPSTATPPAATANGTTPASGAYIPPRARLPPMHLRTALPAPPSAAFPARSSAPTGPMVTWTSRKAYTSSATPSPQRPHRKSLYGHLAAKGIHDVRGRKSRDHQAAACGRDIRISKHLCYNVNVKAISFYSTHR